MFSESTHCSGPRPKSHSAAFVSSSTPTFTGAPIVERSALTRTPSCWLTSVGVLKLLKTTKTSPFGRTTGIEPWSTLQESAGICGLKELPSVHSGERPLISIGVVQWGVGVNTHLDSMIGASQKPPRFIDRLHRGSARKSVQVT